MKKIYYCYCINFDTDGQEIELEEEMFITLYLNGTETGDEIEEQLCNAISEESGWSVAGFFFYTQEEYLAAWFAGDMIESPFILSELEIKVTEEEIKTILERFDLFDAIAYYSEKAEIAIKREQQIKSILE